MSLTTITEYAIITNTEVDDIKHHKFTDEEIERMFKNED